MSGGTRRRSVGQATVQASETAAAIFLSLNQTEITHGDRLQHLAAVTLSMRTIGTIKVGATQRSSGRVFWFGGVRSRAVLLLYFRAVQQSR
jgi:hypothetical protein